MITRMERELQRQAVKYLYAHEFLTNLNKNYKKLTYEEYKILREKALNGDIESAEKRLDAILRSKQ